MKRLLFISALCAFSVVGLRAQHGIPIGDLYYALFDDTHEAMLNEGGEWSSPIELALPSEVNYDGKVYNVTSMSCVAFIFNESLVGVTIPCSIKEIVTWHYNPGFEQIYHEYEKNPFYACSNLKAIEVEEGHPTMCSIDGVLFSKEKNYLFAYPSASDRTSYVVPTGVTRMSGSAFNYCPSLKIVDIPETVDCLEGQFLFRSCPLEALVIRGTPLYRENALSALTTSATIYVQPSEIEKVKRIFGGEVLPLDSYTGIHDISSLNAKRSNLYDLSGRRLTSQPTRGGVYIKDGKKVVVR